MNEFPGRPRSKPRRISGFARFLPHALIVLCGMLLTFFVINLINPAMEFLHNGMTDGIVLAVSILGIVTACLLISLQRRR